MVMGGDGLLRNSWMGFGAPVGRRLGFLLLFAAGLLLAGCGLLTGEGRVGENLLEVRKLLSVVGLLKPRPRMFPRGTLSLVTEGLRGLLGRDVRLVDCLESLGAAAVDTLGVDAVGTLGAVAGLCAGVRAGVLVLSVAATG